MNEEEAVSLLLKASKLTLSIPNASYAAAQEIVRLLGAHTLALIQAGFYISNHCSLSEYSSHYHRARNRLLDFRPKQAQSRYGTVYATFEASALQLVTSGDISGKTALELLGMISCLHHSNLPFEIFESAWVGARSAMEKPPTTQNLNLDSYSIALINQLCRVLPVNSRTWDPVHLRQAFALLDSLALIKIKRGHTNEQPTLISMHPLTHAWTKDRQLSVDTQPASWLCTGALIALSAHAIVWNHWNSLWRTREALLRPHIKSFIDNQKDLDLSAIPISQLLQVEYRCAAILQRMRFDKDLQTYLASIERHESLPLGAILPMAKFRARNLSDLGEFEKSIEYWEYINAIETGFLEANDFVLLVSRHELGTAYLDADKATKAIEIFADIIPKKQQILPEDHDDIIASMHEISRAYLEVGRYPEAVAELERVVDATKRHFEENHPDLLISQHELGRAYLLQGRPQEAISRFLLVIDMSVNRNLMPENHPNLLITKSQLALAYQADGRLVEAIDLFNDVVRYQSTLPENSLSRLKTQSYLAKAYIEHNQFSHAETLLEHIISIRRAMSALDSQELLEEQRRLADLYQKIG